MSSLLACACVRIHMHAHTDVMYGTPWLGGNESVPTGSADEAAELAHAVRRLSAHASIFAWSGTVLLLFCILCLVLVVFM